MGPAYIQCHTLLCCYGNSSGTAPLEAAALEGISPPNFRTCRSIQAERGKGNKVLIRKPMTTILHYACTVHLARSHLIASLSEKSSSNSSSSSSDRVSRAAPPFSSPSFLFLFFFIACSLSPSAFFGHL